MSVIEELKPRRAARVIDLVAAAGHDVSDWKNFKGGIRKESSNPKYCYEWAFVQPGKAVVLNLWYEELQGVKGKIFQRLNYRQLSTNLPKAAARHTWAKRAKAMDDAFALAAARALPVRVIVCDGKRRDVVENPKQSSTVSRRALDPIPWSVANYDLASGDCTIAREVTPLHIEDQFSESVIESEPTSRRLGTTSSFVRDPQVRRRARERANGFCEYCGRLGFTMASNATYIETHHIISLADKGSDIDANVIALCPDDHRRAHHAVEAEALRLEFARIVAAKLKLAR
jgi:5-methylcytosine-specific restriction enzyme A